MPFHLEYFMGGLGNQIFQITALLSLAKKYNTTFSFPIDIYEISGLVGSIKVYQEQIFSEFRLHPLYKDRDNNLPEIKIQVVQFTDINIDNNIDITNISIILIGIPMLITIIENNIEEFRKIFISKKQKLNYFIPQSENIKICIGFRSFDEEGHNEWMVVQSYYKDTLIKMLEKINNSNIELHIFTDRANVSTDIILPILNELNITMSNIYEYKGNRDGISDIEHFYKMMDCDHYILCNSTYHYWPALIKDDSKSIIMYPNKIENNTDDWFKIISPQNWIKIDYYR